MFRPAMQELLNFEHFHPNNKIEINL